ncbi:cAMP-binding domain of CRP or a regulatory subunit of cAMP-dependent protein kinases [Caloramator quimbayensis]|uniref:cAMP-binding domain of CRP or a regulatory subunit of cAMP-dependent protein kinases n=1 Tax=Caloramator quimbayensis TaxID=1147123 RepID=A0A1T4XI19_9CLOT|nr:Crp/Fnr family transcriptional regulator [Caloramator quimbayensis]SKA88755.1 cAMP-binding domain of CRP or a regulatory subunit of cAMP-dependent protein kinases [Caloramator quimbayensis]
MNILNIINIIESNREIYELLKNCPYEILKKFQIKNYRKNTIILNQGSVYEKFYIIVDGLADIFIMAENGKRYTLSIYSKGNYIGELEIFNKIPFTCSVEAITDITMLEIDREDFLKWYDIDKNLSSIMMKTLCAQFYRLSEKAGKDTLYNLKQRICYFLIEEASKNKANKIKNIEIMIDKEKLSCQLAVTKRSINRVLHMLNQMDIISIQNSKVIIKDMEELKKEEIRSRYE